MSCSDNTKNTDIKIATFNSLTNLYTFNPTDELKPNSYNKPFTEFASPVILTDINKELDDNSDNNLNNLFIKDNITSNIYQNCTIQTNNPWFTTSSDYKKCEIVKDITLDDKLKFNADKTSIILDLKSKKKSKTAYSPYYVNVNKAYCENRWYDWIITPNYYLGNTYLKDTSKFTDNDVYKCYKPCDDNYIPYKTEKGELKCIPKKFYANGIFANKLKFSPIGLINLIGNVAFKNNDYNELKIKNKNPLFLLYKNIIDYNIDTYMDNDIYKLNSIYTDYINNSADINIHNAILKDFTKDIYDEFEKCINDNILDDFDTNDNQDYANMTKITYKNKKFNENESEMYTFKGLEACGALIPPILHHTWLLANIFMPFQISIEDITNITTNTTTNDISTADDANKFKTAYTNFDTTTAGIADISIDSKFKSMINRNLFDKLDKIFGSDKAIRLKNIFYKAVNICYDGKTNFSINIIDKTKKSYNKYKDSYSPFLSDYLKIIDIKYDNDNKIFNNEHIFYKDYELSNLSNSYSTTKPNYAIVLDVLLKDDNKFKYFFSIERLEQPTCEKGYIFDSKIGECIEDKIKVIDNADKIAPVEDDFDQFNIPELTNILKMFLQIILVIIILYIIYIFYDIFGETILTVYNFIYMKYIQVTALVSKYEQTQLATNDEEINKINADIDYKLAAIEYNNLDRNTRVVKTYINEHSDKYAKET